MNNCRRAKFHLYIEAEMLRSIRFEILLIDTAVYKIIKLICTLISTLVKKSIQLRNLWFLTLVHDRSDFIQFCYRLD